MNPATRGFFHFGPARPLRPLLVALVVFLLAGMAATTLIRRGEQDHRRELRTRVANLALGHANALQRNIEQALSATYVLATLVRQGQGSVPDFEPLVGGMLALYPGVAELALAPGGIIRSVAPLVGNEKALGFHLLQDPAQKAEALLARNSGKLTLAGPLDLVQGGVGVVGRLPVFLDDATGKPYFWGFTLVVIRVPEALRAAGLPELAQQGYAYKLWRIHAESGVRQSIDASSPTALIEPVMQSLQVSNVVWTLSVMPVKGWGDPLALALQAALGLLFCLLLAYLAKLLVESRAHEKGLEALVAQRTAELEARAADLQNFRTAMDAGADAIYLVDRASMRFVDVNDAACRMHHRTREELLALGPSGVLSIAPEELARTYDSVIAGGPAPPPVEMARQRKDGTQVWVELRRRAQRSGAGWMIVTLVRDISARKQAEQALRDSVQSLRLFTDNVPAMTASYDQNLRCLFGNKRYADFFGISPLDMVGKHLREIIGETAWREVEVHFAQVLQGQPVTYQRTRKLTSGEARYLEVKLLPHVGEQGQVLGCFAVTTDITEHKLAEERIQRVAHHDSLTGLPNRLLFNDRLEQAISLAKRDSRQFALLYLDLDRFKPVNDSLGHAAGDQLLQAVASRIRHQVRESDTLARVGGDEFTVILSDVSKPEEAEIVARKIIAALAASFQLGSQMQSVEIGISIGIAIYPADGQDADTLVKAADAAMYSAKQIGSSYRFCKVNPMPGPSR